MKKTGLSLKLFAVLSIVLLILLLIPLLNAARFNVPSADDYANGLVTHIAWRSTGSLLSVLRAAWNRVYDLYFTWQGTFSAIFLFTLNPMIFGEQFYQIGAWLILGMLLVGIFTLTFSIAGKIFGADAFLCCIIAVVWAIICTQFLPRASQGIYWFTGAVYYTFFFGLAAFAFSVLIAFILRQRGDLGIGKLIGASLLFLFIGGGNLVTGLTTFVLLVSVVLLLVILHRNEWKWMLIPLLFFAVSFGLNVAAPGNAVRQKYFPQPGIIQAVFLSFQEAAKGFQKWFTIPVIVCVLSLIPVFGQIVFRTKFTFVMPGLVSLYSLCLTGVMFYPPIYAMTEHNLDNLGRITNIIFFGMAGLLIFNLFYWMGWLAQRGKLPERLFPAARNGKYSLLYLLVLVLIFVVGMSGIKWFDVSSISAFRSYRSTQMGNYYHTYKQRLEILRDPEVEDAVLKRFPYRPYVLFYEDLSENPAENQNVAVWYGKKSVIAR